MGTAALSAQQICEVLGTTKQTLDRCVASTVWYKDEKTGQDLLDFESFAEDHFRNCSSRDVTPEDFASMWDRRTGALREYLDREHADKAPHVVIGKRMWYSRRVLERLCPEALHQKLQKKLKAQRRQPEPETPAWEDYSEPEQEPARGSGPKEKVSEGPITTHRVEGEEFRIKMRRDTDTAILLTLRIQIEESE